MSGLTAVPPVAASVGVPLAVPVPAPGLPVADEVAALVDRGRRAAARLRSFSQPEVDRVVEAMASAGARSARALAELAVAETGIGNVRDKTVKNDFSTRVVREHLRGRPSVGVLEERDGIVTIAEPFGVVAAITPVTNPTSTVMFKSLIALKGRNVVVFAFHPRAQRSGEAAARLLRDAAEAAGAPPDCIQWIRQPSLDATTQLMRSAGVDLVLATGGAAMVRAAYASGHPALGVGPGNVPAYVDRTADLEQAVADVVASKTFDNGTICASEQVVIFDDATVAQRALQLLRAHGAHVADHAEKARLERVVFDGGRVPVARVVGRTAETVARYAEVPVAEGTRLILVPLRSTGSQDVMSGEKLCPVLGWYVAPGPRAALEAAVRQLESGGAGHSAVIFSRDEAAVRRFALRVPAGRVLWNQPAVQGAIGALHNNLVPSMTLGCGAGGGNSTSDNVGYTNLLSIKRLARRRDAGSEAPGGGEGSRSGDGEGSPVP